LGEAQPGCEANVGTRLVTRTAAAGGRVGVARLEGIISNRAVDMEALGVGSGEEEDAEHSEEGDEGATATHIVRYRFAYD